MSETSQKFEAGESVEWTSQAQGSAVTKRGIITAVIPAGAQVRDHLSGLQRCYAKDFGILPRQQESYVVHVPSKGNGQGKLYWPHVSALRRLTKSREETMRDAASDLYAALIAGLNLFAKGHALDNFNWGASSLTAENIRELNELPGVFRAALAKARGDLPKPPDGGAEPIESKSRGKA